MNNALAQIILEAIKRAEGYTLPESAIKITTENMVRPKAEKEDFYDSFTLLIQRDLVGFKTDEVTEERQFFLKDKGVAYVNKH